MKLIGFAEIPDTDPRLAFIGGGAGVSCDGATMPADLRIVTRRDRVAVAFEIEDSDPAFWSVIGPLTGKAIAARPHLSTRNGLTVIEGLELVPVGAYQQATCWRHGHSPFAMDEYRRSWWAHVVLPPRARALPLPIEGRPHGDGDALHLAIVGEIGAGRYPGAEVAERIRLFHDRTIILDIDSEGGATSDGLKIYRALAAHPHRVEVEIIGRAESMAAIIALAGDVRRIAPDGRMLLHECQIGTPLNASAADLRRTAADMEAMHADFAAIVADATGCGLTIAADWIKAETRFTAGEAVAAGLAHGIINDRPSALPSQPRARFKPISGPYRGVRPASAPAPLYAHGARYKAGQRVRHAGKVYVATRSTFGAPTLTPDHNAADWQAVNA